jgi:hypothetical protein
MKKLFLALTVLLFVSCEREIENVDKNEPIQKTLISKDEKKTNKSASDTLNLQTISSGIGFEPKEPNEDVDPKDIQTPPRK